MKKILLIAALILALFWWFLFPIPGSHRPVTITVHRGSSVHTIADSLYRHRIINSRPAFIVLLKLEGFTHKIKSGNYSFMTGEGVFSAVHSLRDGTPIVFAIMIPEGLTVEQIASRMSSVPGIDESEFIRLCYDSAVAASNLPVSASSLEGFLFPDTYEFSDGTTALEAVRRMTARFKARWSQIDSAAPEHDRDLLRVVTMASIIEKEAVLAAERPRIAGVFYNRLRLNIALGADPTVRYIFKKFNGPLYANELNYDSPYNTRRCRGLPPGPICSPGIASLRAAIMPLRTNELYFVAKWDGSGEHDFSVTNEEHNRKKLLIRMKNRRRLDASGAIPGVQSDIGGAEIR